MLMVMLSYECNYGYMIIGETVRRCERNKVWTGLQPICRGQSHHFPIMFSPFVEIGWSDHIYDGDDPTPIILIISTMIWIRNQLWLSWYPTQWLVGGEQDNAACRRHFQVKHPGSSPKEASVNFLDPLYWLWWLLWRNTIQNICLPIIIIWKPHWLL